MPKHNIDLNFQPAVPCPHCGFVNRPAISGWGGELSTRHKVCKRCELEYTLIVYATSSKDLTTTPVQINMMKRRIELLKQRIARVQGKLIDTAADLADELIRQMANEAGRKN